MSPRIKEAIKGAYRIVCALSALEPGVKRAAVLIYYALCGFSILAACYVAST